MDYITVPTEGGLVSWQIILHAYVEDEQRLRCAVSGGAQTLVETIRTRAPQMQVSTGCGDIMKSAKQKAIAYNCLPVGMTA